jgi:hypothetical protein
MEDKPQDKYPRVTQSQLEIWLDNPVTVNYLKSLEFLSDAIGDTLKSVGLIDSTNNDLSMNRIHSAMGSQNALSTALDCTELLTKYGMVEEKEKSDEG